MSPPAKNKAGARLQTSYAKRAEHYHRIVCDPSMSRAALVTAWELMNHINDVTGECFPSQERMAERLGIDIRTVRRGIDQLVEGGWYSKKPRGRGGTQYFANYGNRTELPALTTNENRTVSPALTEKNRADCAKKPDITPQTNRTVSPAEPKNLNNLSAREAPAEVQAGAVAPTGTPPACAYFKEKHAELRDQFMTRDFEKTVDALTVKSDEGGTMILAAASDAVIDRAENLRSRIEKILVCSIEFKITPWADAAFRYRRARRFDNGLRPNGAPN
jgi:hypothetical protein